MMGGSWDVDKLQVSLGQTLDWCEDLNQSGWNWTNERTSSTLGSGLKKELLFIVSD